MGAVDDAAVELQLVPGLELKHCPEPSCSATIAGPGRILEHHGDGSHTMDWGQPMPRLVAVAGDTVTSGGS